MSETDLTYTFPSEDGREQGHGLPLTFGTILRNNAIVVKTIDNLNGYRYVFAYHTNEWVTWEIDSDGYCYHGHYFGQNDLKSAVEDLYIRSARG